jgi:ABC-2 type transport system ATP-binding protein
MSALACRNVSAGYGGDDVLENVSFNIEAGITCLVGKNGAGKTTLFRVLAGIVAPRKGRVEVLGRDPHQEPCVKDRVGYLAHRPSLYKGLTVEQNLRFWAKVQGIEWSTLGTRVTQLFARFGLDALAGRKGGTLSRGQQQRVAIARMLLTGPALVLMDEPSTGLDAIAVDELHGLVREIRAEGATVVYATHSLPEAIQLGDRFLLIGNHDVVDLGPCAALRETGDAIAASQALLARLKTLD